MKSKFFIDCLLPDGTWKQGSIIWPAADAALIAESMREEHPDWLIELNPVETERL